MSPTIHAGDVTAEELNDLAETLRPDAPHSVVERVDRTSFPGPDEPLQPADWDEGRIFGTGIELHWARQGTDFWAVLTREDGGDSIGLAPAEPLTDYERFEHAYFLWGEEDIRIGRQLEYGSIPGKGRAQLMVAEFYDEAGELRHWRYVRFQTGGKKCLNDSGWTPTVLCAWRVGQSDCQRPHTIASRATVAG